MQITKHKIVSIDYRLTNDSGDEIDSSEGSKPLMYLHGIGNMIPGLESALDGRSNGEQFQVSIQPADAYGLRRDDLRHVVSRDLFGDITDIKVGMQFRAPREDGGQSIVTVVDVDEESVTVDGNHELAGVTLHFDITIRDVREATAEEISHGHAHQPEGQC